MELFTCSAVLLTVITAFTTLSSVFIVSAIVKEPASISIFKCSRGVLYSPAGVATNEQSAREIKQ